MKLIIDFFVSTWYLWVLIILGNLILMLKPKIKGIMGEKSVAFFLSRLDPSKYRIINDVMLEVDGKTAQIDHIVVSNYGIFVIETKNYKGWILGDEGSLYWTQVIYKRKEKLYNPIKQNYVHIQALKENLKEFLGVPYYSIIAFTTNADLKVNTSTDVVYTVNLLKTIEKYTQEYMSNSYRDTIYAKLSSLNIQEKDSRQKHVETIRQNRKGEKDKAERNVCPKCGRSLVLRRGKYGEFKGCSGFPGCRYIVKS